MFLTPSVVLSAYVAFFFFFKDFAYEARFQIHILFAYTQYPLKKNPFTPVYCFLLFFQTRAGFAVLFHIKAAPVCKILQNILLLSY